MENFVVLEVPDLHLFDVEIGQSIGYFKQSELILEGLIEKYESDEKIDMVILGGDIQHSRITSMYAISSFESKLARLATMVYQRLVSKNKLDRVKIYDLEGNLIDLSSINKLLPTVKGNHDASTKQPFTFYNHLEMLEIIITPSVIVVDDTQINFIHYTKDINKLTIPKREEAKTVVAIHHTNVVESGFNTQDHIGDRIDAGLYRVFDGVSLAIMNHIHNQWGQRDYNHTVVITPGSLGRSDAGEKHWRDFGYLVYFEIVNREDIDYGLIKFPLIPIEEFFDVAKIIKVKSSQNSLENFRMEISTTKAESFDPVMEINGMKINDKVKEKCLTLLSSQ